MIYLNDYLPLYIFSIIASIVLFLLFISVCVAILTINSNIKKILTLMEKFHYGSPTISYQSRSDRPKE